MILKISGDLTHTQPHNILIAQNHLHTVDNMK
jgi:hypothetical protein